jgi:hypothetical protein
MLLAMLPLDGDLLEMQCQNMRRTSLNMSLVLVLHTLIEMLIVRGYILQSQLLTPGVAEGLANVCHVGDDDIMLCGSK